MSFEIGGVTADNDTVHEIELEFDSNGKAIAAIQIVGKTSKRFKDADREITRAGLKRSAVRGRALDLKRDADTDEFLDMRKDTNIRLAAAVTVGWYGLTHSGEEFVFNDENARLMYTANSYVLDKVLAAVEDGANFLKR